MVRTETAHYTVGRATAASRCLMDIGPCRGSRTVIKAAPGTVLRLVHVFEEVDTSTHGPDGESGESSSANSVSSATPADTSSVTVDDRQTQTPRLRRSRSPRRHVATNGNWVAGLGVACLTLSAQPTATDAARNCTLLQASQVANSAYSSLWDAQPVPDVSLAVLALAVLGLLLLLASPRSHKMLQEPRGRNASEQAHLDTLRSFVGALGGQWMPRLPFGVQHLALLDVEADNNEHIEVWEETAQVCCVVLAFDFAPAVFSVDLQLPATTEELIAALQPLREERMQLHFPHLLPVLPQPRADVATFIAAPHWCPFRHGVCFDCTRVDNRIYCTFVPEYVNLEEILHIANFPENLALTVWIGPDLIRLEYPARVHTFPGMLFSFLHEGDEPALPVTLGQLLQFRSWDPPFELPEPFFQDAYCLVYSGSGQLFFADPAVPMRYRHRIAEATGANLAHMRLYASEQRPRDAAINGVPCTTIVAVGDRRRDYVQPAWHMALLDCRFIEMGWNAVYVTSGTFDIQKVLDDFDRHAPLGWHTILLGGFPQTGLIAARPGQIFVLAYASGAHNRTSLASAEHGEEQTGSFPHASHGEPPNSPPEPGTPEADAGSRTDAQNPGGVPVEIHCLILMPEYAQEHVVVPVVLPASVDTVLRLVDQVRDAQYRHFFGRLIPVDVQPALGAACLLAVPDWAFEGVPALFVCFAPPVRVFTLVVPAILSTEGILRIVGANAHMQVFVRDVPWALPADASTPVRSGDLFSVFPTGHPYIPPITLASMLRTAEGWHDEPVLPRPPSDRLWLLTELSSHHFSFQASPEVSLRVAVEWHLDCAPEGLEVLPATPAIRDHSRRGFTSRQVYAALPHDLLPGVPFILDQRPILLDIVWVYAPGGRFDVATLLERHRQRCPDSHFMRLSGGHSPPGHENHERYVHPGQVLTLAFWKRRSGGAFPTPDGPPDSDDGDSHDSSEDASDDQGNEGTGDEHAFSRGSASTTADAGTGSTAGFGYRVLSDEQEARSDIVKWDAGPRADALPEGRQYLTTALLPAIIFLLAYAFEAGSCQYGQGHPVYDDALQSLGQVGLLLLAQRCLSTAASRRTAVCWVFLYFSLSSTVIGTFSPGTAFSTKDGLIKDVSARRGCDNMPKIAERVPDPKFPACQSLRLPNHWATGARRPVPTPLRQGGWTKPPAVEPDFGDFDLGGLETLLEQALRQGQGQAMFLAATLVETLSEHFNDTSRGPPLSSSFASDVDGSVLRLADHLPTARVFNLEDIHLPIGCTLDNVAALFQGTPAQLAPLPVCGNEFLQQWNQQYRHLPSIGKGVGLKSLAIYTDGSFDGTNATAGRTVSLAGRFSSGHNLIDGG